MKKVNVYSERRTFMKQIYLPRLSKIVIGDYSLYLKEPSFEYVFEDGINAVIGANGIGKTTFVNLIIYSLVGHKKSFNKPTKTSKKPLFEYVDEDYFSARMSPKFDFERNKNASVTLEFMLARHRLIIKRSLYENKILGFWMDQKEYGAIDEEEFQAIITNCSNIQLFSSFEKIVREFLLFDEQRKNIAWEVDTQDEILKILLFDEEYYCLLYTSRCV